MGGRAGRRMFRLNEIIKRTVNPLVGTALGSGIEITHTYCIMLDICLRMSMAVSVMSVGARRAHAHRRIIHFPDERGIWRDARPHPLFK